MSGIVFLGFSYAMHRMAKGGNENHSSFLDYARHIGDGNVKPRGAWWRSAVVWGRVILFSAGVVLVLVGVWIGYIIPRCVQLLTTGFVCLVIAFAADDMAYGCKANRGSLTYLRVQIGKWIERRFAPLCVGAATWVSWLIFIGGTLLIVTVTVHGIFTLFK